MTALKGKQGGRQLFANPSTLAARVEPSTFALLVSLINGEAQTDRHPLSPHAQGLLTEAAVAHGVYALIYRQIRQNDANRTLPITLVEALARESRAEATRDVLLTHELRSVLEHLRRSAVRPLVLKGAALAHLHYPNSFLRPRCDTDILIDRHQRPAAVRALEQIGYARCNSVGREAVHTQWTFQKMVLTCVPHYIDLHWAISNRPLFAAMFTYAEFENRSVLIPRLSEHGRTLRNVDALLFACIHRVGHNNSLKLIWLYDIKLLAEALSPVDWEEFWQIATEKQIGRLCIEGLAATAKVFGGTFTVAAYEPRGRHSEPSALYLGNVDTWLQTVALDIRHSSGIMSKLRLLASHAFPDARYMRAAYGTRNVLGLLIAYVIRAIRGVRRLNDPAPNILETRNVQ